MELQKYSKISKIEKIYKAEKKETIENGVTKPRNDFAKTCF